MAIGRPIPVLTLTVEERDALERWARRPTTAQELAQRARLVLACARGRTNTEVARELRLTKQTVGKWRSRFLAAHQPRAVGKFPLVALQRKIGQPDADQGHERDDERDRDPAPEASSFEGVGGLRRLWRLNTRPPSGGLPSDSRRRRAWSPFTGRAQALARRASAFAPGSSTPEGSWA